MFFIVVGALSLIGSASAATNNGTNNLSHNIVSISSDSALTHSVVKVSNVEEDIGIDEVSNKLWIVNSTYSNNEIQTVIEGTNSGDTIRFSSGVYDRISLSVK
jgi:hypothetical protein